MIQTYAISTNKIKEEIEECHVQLSKILSITNYVYVKAGARTEGDLVYFGIDGLEGDRLVQFCRGEQFNVFSTNHELMSRWSNTWKFAANDIVETFRRQVYYIVIKRRFPNELISVKIYLVIDILSNHNPVICKLHINWKKLNKLKKTEWKSWVRKVEKCRDTRRRETNTEWSIKTNNPYGIWNKEYLNFYWEWRC